MFIKIGVLLKVKLKNGTVKFCQKMIFTGFEDSTAGRVIGIGKAVFGERREKTGDLKRGNKLYFPYFNSNKSFIFFQFFKKSSNLISLPFPIGSSTGINRSFTKVKFRIFLSITFIQSVKL